MPKTCRIFHALVLLASLFAGSAFASSAPTNVIFFIGDGMGPEHVKAASMYYGEPLVFETFRYQGLVTTYSASSSITDSAAAATAIATGHKVNNGIISIATPGDGSELETLLEYWRDRGKSTGLVTTTYMTHATPAAFGAHEPSRNNLSNIGSDYINQTRPNVLLGGGANGMTVAAAQLAGYTTVSDRAGLAALNTDNVSCLSGQFGTSHLPYVYDEPSIYPGLPGMTRAALDILENDPDGFFLMVEGGRIDHAAHANDIERNIFETLAFDNAVREALSWASGRKDTLILVTADHETGGLIVDSNNGPGSFPDVTWTTGIHTGTNVPVYAWGFNAQLVGGVMNNTDMFAVVSADPAPGDTNGDGKVDGADLAAWQQHYDPLGVNADNNMWAWGNWNFDNRIDGADLALWQQNYDPLGAVGLGPPLGLEGADPVPEPGTLLLGATALGLLITCRRRRTQ